METISTDLEKLPSKVPLEQFDISSLSKDKIRDLYRSGRIPTAEAFVDEIFLRAAKQGATDIHFQPMETQLKIRIGREGVLKPLISLPKEIADNLASVLKTRGSLNAFEKKKPQEGRFSLTFGTRQFDVRINTVPLITGERVALRFLQKDATVASLEELAFSPENLVRMKALLGRPSGLLLVAGPSGSGKSTTIYAGVNALQSDDKNIMTVEDPVEYKLDFASQVSITVDKSVTYADAARSILRQNPDVIMIGEIRDAETGVTAAEAAVTGSLVLSTILANDSVGTIHRLLHLGIPPYWIASSLAGVVYQTLFRKICQECREEYTPDDVPALLKETNPARTTFFRGKGCPSCQGTGYRGRIAVHEILTVTDRIRDLIYQNAPGTHFKSALTEAGFETLAVDAAKKTAAGLTTLDEFRRTFS